MKIRLKVIIQFGIYEKLFIFHRNNHDKMPDNELLIREFLTHYHKGHPNARIPSDIKVKTVEVF